MSMLARLCEQKFVDPIIFVYLWSTKELVFVKDASLFLLTVAMSVKGAIV